METLENNGFASYAWVGFLLIVNYDLVTPERLLLFILITFACLSVFGLIIFIIIKSVVYDPVKDAISKNMHDSEFGLGGKLKEKLKDVPRGVVDLVFAYVPRTSILTDLRNNAQVVDISSGVFYYDRMDRSGTMIQGLPLGTRMVPTVLYINGLTYRGYYATKSNLVNRDTLIRHFLADAVRYGEIHATHDLLTMGQPATNIGYTALAIRGSNIVADTSPPSA